VTTDSQNPDLSRVLLGDSGDRNGGIQTMSTRDAYYAREMEMSRRPPSGRNYERVGNDHGVQD
jgi:hypothetical protein